MKGTTILFLLWVFFVVLTIFRVYVFPTWFLILMFFFWIFAYYMRIHNENKREKIPKPVYLSLPEEN